MPAAQSAAFQHDQPQVSNDLYSRKPFAEQLASLLVLPPKSPGVVIGIEGPWGSGKTTVVRYIVESLKTAADGAPIVVEFNPWMLAGAFGRAQRKDFTHHLRANLVAPSPPWPRIAFNGAGLRYSLSPSNSSTAFLLRTDWIFS